ncbi:HNH endonuclease [Corynebacterium guaraldiae]|nr:HNH endonuclease [Corynebacterium guaraldiae]
MSWSTSDRRKRLPSDWSRRRLEVLRRDQHQCRAKGPGCKGRATEVDHILRGDDHSLNNLQALCSVCHRRKTLSEAQAASARRRSRRFRSIESHPGMR